MSAVDYRTICSGPAKKKYSRIHVYNLFSSKDYVMTIGSDFKTFQTVELIVCAKSQETLQAVTYRTVPLAFTIFSLQCVSKIDDNLNFF